MNYKKLTTFSFFKEIHFLRMQCKQWSFELKITNSYLKCNTDLVRWWTSQLINTRSEALGFLANLDVEYVISVLEHGTFVDELGEEVHGCSFIFLFLLHKLDFLLQNFELIKLRLFLQLFLFSGRFFIGNLLRSAPALAPRLQQVSWHALGSCNKRSCIRVRTAKVTYCWLPWRRWRWPPSLGPS